MVGQEALQLLQDLRNENESTKRKALDKLSALLAPYIRSSKYGPCFAWGSGRNYQLGETGAFANEENRAPRRVDELPADLVCVATSKLLTAVVSRSGAVWTSGWNSGADKARKARLFFHPVAALERLRVTCVAVSVSAALLLIHAFTPPPTTTVASCW